MSDTPGTVGWFEIGTGDPDTAERYYGGLFGWSFTREEGEVDYRLVSFGTGAPPSGGVRGHGGRMHSYAIFFVKVDDVAATVARSGQLGGQVLVPPTKDDEGLVFAQLTDPAGNAFGVYTEPPRG
ncbi:MAG: VOC family protein [Actinobacteria bacterium]|nr:VOC family protein [Actinomycetota bacterium]